eukprot:3974631-Amphidinium_carterae.1
MSGGVNYLRALATQIRMISKDCTSLRRNGTRCSVKASNASGSIPAYCGMTFHPASGQPESMSYLPCGLLWKRSECCVEECQWRYADDVTLNLKNTAELHARLTVSGR